jgi:hypothetical protein
MLPETAAHPAEQAAPGKPTLRVTPPPWWLVASWAAVGLSVLLWLAPLKLGLWPLCLLRTLTGIPCPTCGATHTLMRLFEADLLGAARCNPLIAMLGLAVSATCVVATPLWLANRLPALRPGEKELRLARVLVVLAVAANWIYLLFAAR